MVWKANSDSAERTASGIDGIFINAGFDKTKVFNEWKRFRFSVKSHFADNINETNCAAKIWT